MIIVHHLDGSRQNVGECPVSCCRLEGSDSLSVQRRGASDLFGESIPNCYGNISILVASART